MFDDLIFDLDDEDGFEPHIYLDVPYVPTDEKVVEAMLDLAGVGAKDVLYDLGSGDGRIVVAAALYRNARAVGIEMDPLRVADAMEYAADSRVEFMVDFIEGDLLTEDFSEATVVSLYLLDLVNVQLRPRLMKELRAGTRIVSNTFDMGDWKADKRLTFGGVNIYLWYVPAHVAGMWQWKGTDGQVYRVDLQQAYQQLTGKAWINGTQVTLKSAVLQGVMLELVFADQQSGREQRFVMQYEDYRLQPAEGEEQQATPGIRLL